MKKKTRIKKLITHDGSFHPDDVFACATISMVMEKRGEKVRIIRTRDRKTENQGDYVVDTGGVYDEKRNRFDHHQSGGPGKRPNGIEYASFGLVWKKFGPELSDSREVAKRVDEHLASPVDADDNGIKLFENKHEVAPFLIQDFFKLLRPTCQEVLTNPDKSFFSAVTIAKEILSRSIMHEEEAILAEKKVLEAYKKAKDKRIIILNRYYPFKKVFDRLPKPLFVIFPREGDNLWAIKTVSKKNEEFKNRKDLPKKWAGLAGEKLARISGVPDAMFCHRGLFIATALSKDGAVKMAQIAVRS